MGVLSPELVERYAVVHHPRGPRLTLGTIWFLLLLIAYFVGDGALAIFFGANAAVAALQTCARWIEKRQPANSILAGAGALAIGCSAYFGNRLLGITVLVYVALAVLFSRGFGAIPKDESGKPAFDVTEGISDAWITVAAGFLPGLAAASVVQIHRIDGVALAFLGAAVCTYDAGDHLTSAGYASRTVGPLSGIGGVFVVTAVMTIIGPDPLSGVGVWFTGILLAALCPLGQWLASWMLPSADAEAPGLRRLDGWLLTAPVFWAIVAVAA